MPAAAVIREGQALSGITGRKESVDGKISFLLNFKVYFKTSIKYCFALSLIQKSGILYGRVKSANI